MTTKADLITVDKLEKDFIEAFHSGLNGLKRAGDILVKMLEADPTVKDRIIEHHGLPHSTLNMLEKIGRGVVLPKIAWTYPRLERLSIGDQRRAVEGSVPMVIVKGNDVDTIQVNLLRASKEVQDQILSGDHIRTPDEQRAFLMGKANSEAMKQKSDGAKKMPWRRVGKTIHVDAGTILDRSAILTMLRALEG